MSVVSPLSSTRVQMAFDSRRDSRFNSEINKPSSKLLDGEDSPRADGADAHHAVAIHQGDINTKDPKDWQNNSSGEQPILITTPGTDP